ncbi:PstS family phosphate ABC transporter substrate-binding protein [Parahaliea aestuarii]|uniref:Phosphate-binding protein n=1 Tax=Parahaliea aestuarii TaxID=1852021 RepID=A0A5C8ZT55_9GAMM|nr:phosphate ABC transporter substrate-binding protein PstS family protein [Parahaliea aestuarii]TXS90949.1 phosphate ABC transporter substrate-binding protein PstS family protein [Parahaliea aestuarii]
MKLIKTALAVIGLGLASSLSANEVDPALADYEVASGVSGNLSSIGSDTLANLMTLWAEEFKRAYPNVNIQIQAAGSSTAPPALTEGTANLGPMSRKMKDKEIEAFETRFGYKPTAVPVAIDALAVYVHKDNPIAGMTIADVDAVFSSTRRCGRADDVSRWGGLGLEGAWASRDMQLFGRNSVSGTYGYFKEVALCKGDFKNTVNEQPGSASVVQSVSTSINGIGYSGIGYKTSSVRAVPLSKKQGDEMVEATPENAVTGAYPLSRFLYVYINKDPNTPLSPLEREFVRLVFSRQGQEVVLKDGYIPLPAAVVERLSAQLGL